MAKPPYQKRCIIRLHDGTEYEAELYSLNPQYHQKAKPEQLERWRRTGNVPKKERWIDCDQVEEWRLV